MKASAVEVIEMEDYCDKCKGRTPIINVDDVMTRLSESGLFKVTAKDTVSEAIKVMKYGKKHRLAVYDEGRPRKILNVFDLVDLIGKEDDTIGAIFSSLPDIYFARTGDDFMDMINELDVSQTMTLVTDKRGEIAGIITPTDIQRYVKRNRENETEY